MVFLWIFIALVAIVLIGDFCFRRYATSRIKDIFENVPPFGIVPTTQSPEATTIQIQTKDGLTLSGSIHKPKNNPPRALVIFFPELNGSHWMVNHYCQALIDDGNMVLGFDFRNQGDSDAQEGYTPIHWITEFEMADVSAVLEYIRNEPELSGLPLAAFGVSRGGAAAIAAACRHPKIQTVITDSSFGTMSMTRNFVERFFRYVVPDWFFRLLPDWHVELTLRQAIRLSEIAHDCSYVHIDQEIRNASALTALNISGSRDSYVTSAVAQDLANLFTGSDCMLVIRKAKHNMARSVDPETYDAAITQHLREQVTKQLDNGSDEPDNQVEQTQLV